MYHILCHTGHAEIEDVAQKRRALGERVPLDQIQRVLDLDQLLGQVCRDRLVLLSGQRIGAVGQVQRIVRPACGVRPAVVQRVDQIDPPPRMIADGGGQPCLRALKPSCADIPQKSAEGIGGQVSRGGILPLQRGQRLQMCGNGGVQLSILPPRTTAADRQHRL